MFRLLCSHICFFYSKQDTCVTRGVCCVFVCDACCALPAEPEPCPQGHTLHLGKGKAEVLQGKHSPFPHRSILLLISSQEQNYWQGTVGQGRGKAPALPTEAALLWSISPAQKELLLVLLFCSYRDWGFFVPRKQEPVPSPVSGY